MSHSFSTALPETGQTGPAAEEPGRPGQASGPAGGRGTGRSRRARSRRAPAGRPRVPVVERIAGWSARHRKMAVLGWLVMVAAIFVVGSMLPASSVPSNDAGQSGQAEQTLQRLGFTAPPAESVLIQQRGSSASGGPFATNPAMRQAVRQVVAALARLPRSASGIESPLQPGHAGLVSADGRSALVTFKVPGNAASEDQAVGPALQAVAAIQGRHPGLIVGEAGDASTDRAANAAVGQDFRKAEVTSVPITLVLLIAVFGALIAAGIPLLLAATAVMTAISLLAIPGQWLPVGSSTSEVVLIIGMAVGIDYSLFYLRREREERARGASTGQALRIAAGTSGRAIVISGLTVMIALAGLFLTGYAVFTGIAIGTIAVVGVAVVGSLTVVPALLSWLGPWADRGRIPFLGRRRTAARPSRLWAALVRRVVARPLAWGSIAALAMIALAVPGLGMRIGSPADGGFGGRLPVIQTLDRIDQAFPGSPSPAQVVVTGRDLAGPRVMDAIAALRARASAGGPIRGPVTVAPVADGRALLVDVPLAGNGTDHVSNDALLALRDRILPETLGRAGGVSYAVAGNTAENYDDIAVLRSRTPLVLAVVAVLAFVLLLVAFRSVAIPLVSILLNLLSVGAAYGLITLIFQDGRLAGLLGFTSYGAIVPWIPLFMFVFLFGLSMDYHVFILSRIRELRARGAATPDAIVGGIASSAGVVTSAAVIMVAVFSILATLSLIQLKMLGVGLGAAVLIDATVVRGILVPAALALLGERSWYLPRWLGWLPGRTPDRASGSASGRAPASASGRTASR
jgi:putative drug exporter of the RND superfamily